MSTRPQLSVIMPVYNEAAAITTVLAAWADALTRLEIDYELRIYDDGSTDATPLLLEAGRARIASLVVTRQANAGHGATVLRGYQDARGEWVFQCDADDEIHAGEFAAFWKARDAYDVVLGVREGRHAPLARRVVTAMTRLTVRTFFDCRLRDVNCPFRLFRADALRRLLPYLPSGTFAPNVALSGLAARGGLRILELPVTFHPRRTGESSLGTGRLWSGALRAFGETVAVARQAARRRP